MAGRRVSFRTINVTPRALIHGGEILLYSRAWQRVAGNRNLIALSSINNTKSDSEHLHIHSSFGMLQFALTNALPAMRPPVNSEALFAL